jgi:hypothetical protein
VESLEVHEDTFMIHSRNNNRVDIAKAVTGAGGTLYALEEQEMNLQNLFLKIIQEA